LYALEITSGTEYKAPSGRLDMLSPAVALRDFYYEYEGVPTDNKWDGNRKLTDAEWKLEVKVISDTIFLSLT